MSVSQSFRLTVGILVLISMQLVAVAVVNFKVTHQALRDGDICRCEGTTVARHHLQMICSCALKLPLCCWAGMVIHCSAPLNLTVALTKVFVSPHNGHNTANISKRCPGFWNQWNLMACFAYCFPPTPCIFLLPKFNKLPINDFFQSDLKAGKRDCKPGAKAKESPGKALGVISCR